MASRDEGRAGSVGPYLALVFVVITWALNFSMIRLAFAEWTPTSLMLARCLIAFPFLLLVCYVLKEKPRPSRATWMRLTLAGFMGSGLYMILFVEGMKRSGAAEGAITLSTAPIFVALLSFLRGDEKPSWQWIVGSLLAFGGVVLTHREGLGHGYGGLGFALLLGSAFVWGVSVFVFRPVVKEIGALSAMALSMPGALLALGPYAGPGLVSFDFSKLTLLGIGTMTYMALVSGSITFVLYYWSIKEIGAAKASAIQYLIPPTAALLAVVVLHDHLKPDQVAGLAAALAGVALAQWRTNPAKQGKMEA